MVIKQEEIIKKIAGKENISISTVRRVFKSAESIIFEYLTSVEPYENIIIKIFNGYKIKRKYIGKKNCSNGMFINVECPSHVNIKGSVSKHYINKINKNIF